MKMMRMMTEMFSFLFLFISRAKEANRQSLENASKYDNQSRLTFASMNAWRVFFFCSFI